MQLVTVTRHVFGIFAICVILLNLGGCGTPGRQPMSIPDLNTFRVDCSKRDEQIRFLSSQLMDRDDMLMARVGAAVRPWEAVTDPGTYAYRKDIGNGRTNWFIKQQIHILQTQC